MILGLLCVHFDAGVVFAMKVSTLFRFTPATLWMGLLTNLSPVQLNYGCRQLIIYIDQMNAAVVFVMKFLTLFIFTLAILWMGLLTKTMAAGKEKAGRKQRGSSKRLKTMDSHTHKTQTR